MGKMSKNILLVVGSLIILVSRSQAKPQFCLGCPEQVNELSERQQSLVDWAVVKLQGTGESVGRPWSVWRTSPPRLLLEHSVHLTWCSIMTLPTLNTATLPTLGLRDVDLLYGNSHGETSERSRGMILPV